MSTDGEILASLVRNYEDTIAKQLKLSESFYYVFTDIVRQVDVFGEMLFSKSFDGNESAQMLMAQNYAYGWQFPLTTIIPLIAENVMFYPHITDRGNKFWSDSVIQVCGKLALVKRYLQLEKGGVLKITREPDNRFVLQFNNEVNDVEYLERENFRFVQKMAEEIKTKDYQLLHEQYPVIKREMKKLLQNPLGKYISYGSSPRIDDFYLKLGYLHLFIHQGHEDFGEDDSFGGISYRHYLNFVQDLAGVALKHRDFCHLLLLRNPRTDPYSIFTYECFHDRTVDQYAQFYSLPPESIKQIISCVTLDVQNYAFYNEEPGSPLPAFFRVGNSLIRTISGCLKGSVYFLKKELKRQFPSDYFKAVNRREERFRNELYLFFKEPRFITIEKEWIIKTEKYHTDVDAVIYDSHKNILALFQLKWQDTFGNSLRERYSRIKNLFPKSVEWIDKVSRWSAEHDSHDVLRHAGIPPNSRLNKICLFIIGRNHVHFSGETLDPRAAWGSWYQVAKHIFTGILKQDSPLEALHTALAKVQPDLIFQEKNIVIQPFDIKLEEFVLSYRG